LKLRSRLVLSFSYVLLTVIVALTIPLAINLSRRAEADLASDTLVTAQSLAASIDGADIQHPERLARTLGPPPSTIERVVVTDSTGAVVYDSSGAEEGQDFATPSRAEMAQALAGTPTAGVRYSTTLGHDIMVAAVPIIDRGLVGAIRLTRDAVELRAAERRALVGLIVIDAAALLAGILFAFGLAGSLMRPIQRLGAAARQLGGGDLSARAGSVGGSSEVEDLAASFDEMAERLQRTVQAQREFVANASHQLRTPLTGMKLRLESAAEAPTNEEVRRRVQAAERETDRLAEIVDRLLVMAGHGEQGKPSNVNLVDAVRQAADRWHERAQQAGGTLSVEGRGALIAADPNEVAQILDILLENAIRYGPGPIHITSDSADGHASISVRDRGPGIPPDERDRVVERFFRGKGANGAGSGLGLAIARELAGHWGGALAIEEPPGGGATITVTFALSSATTGERPRRSAP
jgi:two-component system, OmpR family, sensor kinase